MADISNDGDADIRIRGPSTNEAEVNGDNQLHITNYENTSQIPVWDSNNLTTTTTTAQQVVGTYIPVSGRELVFSTILLYGERSTPTNTNAVLGLMEFQYTPDGTTWFTIYSVVIRTGIVGVSANTIQLQIPEGIRLTGNGTIGLRAVVTPTDTTSTDWQFILMGHEFVTPI